MGDCKFCQIVRGDRTAHVVYEGDRATAFLDANPAVEGHTLVVPNAHVEELFAADEATWRAVFDAAGTLTGSIDRVLDPDGFSTVYTSGGLVGQVDHAHVHLLPRTADDGIGFALSRRTLGDEAATGLARRIRDVQ